jgi:tetratricopeptide (TPR) repeat protein
MRVLLGRFEPALLDLNAIQKPEELTDLDNDVFTIVARCHVELGQWKEAIAAADKGIEHNTRLKRPADKALFWRGRARIETKEFAAAASDLTEVAKLEPEAARSQYWLAKAYAGERKFRDAAESLEAAKKLAGAEDFGDIDELLAKYEAEAEKTENADEPE